MRLHSLRIALAFVAALGMLVASGSWPALGARGETLIVPFVNGPAGVTTAGTYLGVVAITVSGFGQAAGTQHSDAFYIFTDGFGNPRTPEHINDFGLWINDQPVEHYVGVLPYRGDHTYRFAIKSLAQVRRLQVPAVQLNIAEQQINVAS